jgi:glycosyltransferase involved in cell wall biosynthesis
VVTTYVGTPGVDAIRRESQAGRRPRKDYVELADRTGGLVIDYEHMAERAGWAPRHVARRAGLPAGQVLEALARQGRHDVVLAWADRLGLPLALAHKLSRPTARLVMASYMLTTPKKAIPMRALRLHSDLAAIVTTGTAQLEMAATRLGVPREKLRRIPIGVDDRFWTPRQGGTPANGPIVAVGWEERDYETLLRAASGSDLRFELAVGRVGASATTGVTTSELGPPPPNVRLHANLSSPELRDLYARAQFVVVPLKDVDYDSGSLTITEAMAMGKAVVVTRTRGQRDLVREGEHGRYVPPRDPGALREVMQRLAADPNGTAAMGDAGRRLVERTHTLDGYVAALADVIAAARS